MKTHFFNLILFVVFVTLSARSVRAAEEQELIAILQSSAGAVEKCAACQQLRIHSTAKSVPALAALLGQERVGHAARYALEGIPGPEAVAALREALTKTSGLAKAGIINSLGWRRDAESVPLLVPLISDANTAIAKETVSALSRIGGEKAVAALIAARENSNPTVRRAVLEALLLCAENRLSAGDNSGAAALYGDLFSTDVPTAIRIAAWRGLVLSNDSQRPELVVKALTGNDEQLRLVALKLVREIKDEQLIKACLQQWDSLGASAQVAVLDAHLQFGAEALPTIRTASKSPHPEVRIAAWQALADLSDTSMIPALVQAAAKGEPSERDAARDTLARIHGPGVRDALLAHLKQAETAEKIELLFALGKRSDTASAPMLLQYAKAPEENIRLAALESLRRLAVTDTLLPLLDLAVTPKSASDRDAILKALVAVCQTSPDKDNTSRQVIAAMNRLPASERRYVLPVLLELATDEALNEMLKSTQQSDTQLVRESIRLLTQWPNAAPAENLFAITRTNSDPSLRTLALRGAITVAGREPDPSARLGLIRQALSLSNLVEGKKLALSQLGRIPLAEALEMSLRYLDDPQLVNEAGLAAVSIAESLAKTNPQLADKVSTEVLKHCKMPAIVKRAWALRVKPAAGGPFIRDWLVCGPYRKTGVVGAVAVFDLAFGPEKPGEDVKWYAAPAGDTINLMGLFPNQTDCVAYLKTEIIAPEATDAILLMGSDDGIKVWLNGTVVHSNNVDRGQVVDQDMAPIKLKQGSNELMLKITQGGGGWSVCTRIVGPDGLPIKDLHVKSQSGQAPPISSYKPAPETKTAPEPAKLPAPEESPKLGEGFRLHIINADSRFEAACVADINRDGKLDIFCGGFWYEAPSWKKHLVRNVTEQDDYYYDFANLPMDIDGDGWIDIADAAWHNKKVFWLRNPGKSALHQSGTGSGGQFEVIDIDTPGNIETAIAVDINGDGQLDVLPNIMGQAAWYEFLPDKAAPHGVKWIKHQLPKQIAAHGIGAGDINGDGRCDIIAPAGWLEQTTDTSEPWLWHAEFNLGPTSIPILVHDVDADGDADIIWGMGHNYGIYWLEQNNSDGNRSWKKHLIDDSWSQPHFLLLADLDNDGTDELVTGKRFHAHNGHDPGGNEPKCVYYYKFDRNEHKWQRHLIHEGGDVGFGINTAACDIDGDGDIDIVAPGKSGLFLIENLLK
jgi:HEAT repeat protein